MIDFIAVSIIGLTLITPVVIKLVKRLNSDYVEFKTEE
jgi:hypothetical protein